MVQVNHLITKRVVKGSLRIFFQLVNGTTLPMKGHVLLELRWLFGACYNIDAPLLKSIEAGQNGFFYIDVPKGTGKKFKSFEWVWVDDDKNYKGEAKKIDKFQDLV